MVLIEGVGDEVVQFMGVVLVVLVGALAWWSTNARPDRYRTVLVMRSRPHHPVSVSISTRPSLMVSSTPSSSVTPPVTEPPVASTPEVPEESRDARVIPLQEMDSIVDADMAMLDNNRLHFYRRIDAPNSSQSAAESTSDESEMQEEPEPASTAQMREMDSIVNAMEAEITSSFECCSQEPNSLAEADSKPKIENTKSDSDATPSNSTDTPSISAGGDQGTSGDEKKILIKLKYLNDTLKEVEGSLDELLKDFKWRHFSSELSRSCRVRLIFNGRVLCDEATLRSLGLHHRAVVHALVHPAARHPHNNTQQLGNGEERPMDATHELITEGVVGERAWDLENILMTLVSVALTVVWFFRCEYSNMFTASASVALFGLTVFYSVAIFGLYLSDSFHFDRRQPRPNPTPTTNPPPQAQVN